MGKKIFISYKYRDTSIEPLPDPEEEQTKVRDYVNEIQSRLEEGDNIYKGEEDNSDLSELVEETIAKLLSDRMYDSTITIVLISKDMKDSSKPERDQWIPWEISYSLKEINRGGKQSLTNAILAVVIPDEDGSYEYFLVPNPKCNSTTYFTARLFKILSRNMFNKKEKHIRDCNGTKIHSGNFSYIHVVKWDDFLDNIDKYIDIAVEIQSNVEDYEIEKQI